MSEKNVRGPSEFPNLKDDEQEFATALLSVNMPYENVVQAFLDAFPDFLEYVNENLTEKELKKQLGNRFREMRRNKRRVAYHKIKETKDVLKTLLDCLPVASPLMRLIRLEQRRQEPNLTLVEEIKIFNTAAKEVDRLIPPERSSPLGSLPNLMPNLEPVPEGEAPDPFGGAMMKNIEKKC